MMREKYKTSLYLNRVRHNNYVSDLNKTQPNSHITIISNQLKRPEIRLQPSKPCARVISEPNQSNAVSLFYLVSLNHTQGAQQRVWAQVQLLRYITQSDCYLFLNCLPWTVRDDRQFLSTTPRQPCPFISPRIYLLHGVIRNTVFR